MARRVVVDDDVDNGSFASNNVVRNAMFVAQDCWLDGWTVDDASFLDARLDAVDVAPPNARGVMFTPRRRVVDALDASRRDASSSPTSA